MMEYSLDGHNVSLSAIRTVRVLRPLRAINRVPSKWPPHLTLAWGWPTCPASPADSSQGPTGAQDQEATRPI